MQPDLDRVAVGGHSMGGVLSANVAAVATANGLPNFKAVFCAEPGTGGFGPYENYADIPSGTLLLTVVGNDDVVVGDGDARKIYTEAVLVPADDKDFIRVFADGYGDPDLLAGHNAPLAGLLFPPDAVDWYGFWKWLDALTDAAFFGTNRDVALGNTAAQRLMGYWSDGTPVTEATVTDAP